MLKTKHFILIILCFWQIICLAKSYSYKHFSVEDGLPSSEVYSVIQDDDGFMWFATDRGVARYDGYEFETFTTENGLPDNVIFRLQKDYEGKIWFACFSGELGYFDDGKPHTYEYNSLIQESVNSDIILSFYVDRAETVYIGFKRSGLMRIDKNGILSFFKESKCHYNLTRIDDCVMHYFDFILETTNKQHETKLQYSEKNETFITFKVPALQQASGFRYINSSVLYNQEIFFSIGPVLYNLKNNQIEVIHQFNHGILDIKVFDNKLWIGLFNGGFCTLDIESNYVKSKDGLREFSITGIYQSTDQLMWFTTLNNGIFVSNVNHYSLTKKGGFLIEDIYAIKGNHNRFLMRDMEGNVICFFTKKDSSLPIFNFSQSEYKNIKLNYNQYDDFFILQHDNLSDRYYKIMTDLSIEYINYPGKTIVFSDDSIYSFFRHYNFDKLKKTTPWNSKHTFITIPDYDSYGIRHGTVINERILLFGINGILECDRTDGYTKFIHLGEKHVLFHTRVVDICPLTGYDFIAATRGEGILFVKNEIPLALKKKHGLISDQITSLYVDSSQTIWAGSSEGLSIIQPDFTIKNLRVEDGLISNEITDIIVNNDKAYIGTKKGLTVLDVNSIQKQNIDIPVYFKRISISNNQEIIAKKNTLKLDHDEPVLNIKFVGISFKSIGRIKYRYRLNENELWQHTKNNELTFSNLASGDYRLEIQASNGENAWSKEPAILFIHVSYPFWETTPFYIIVSLLIGGLFFLIYRLSINRIKSREGLKQQIQNLRFEALSAQMNPHFMFNSLNSIQNFIMQNERKASVRYLSKFAKLMRMTLNHSQQKNISLSDELDALELYLTLEMLRFDNQFDYEIKLQENLNSSEVIIPALLIQPIVENAILHGIRPMTEKGHILIDISRDENQLQIQVEDNGVGRNLEKMKQAGKKADGHDSKGSFITEERIALFAKEFNGKYDFKIFDLKLNNQANGTRVNMSIPFTTIKTTNNA